MLLSCCVQPKHHHYGHVCQPLGSQSSSDRGYSLVPWKSPFGMGFLLLLYHPFQHRLQTLSYSSHLPTHTHKQSLKALPPCIGKLHVWNLGSTQIAVCENKIRIKIEVHACLLSLKQMQQNPSPYIEKYLIRKSGVGMMELSVHSQRMKYFF